MLPAPIVSRSNSCASGGRESPAWTVVAWLINPGMATTGTVLVVDDDPRLRHLVDVIVSGAGFRVLTAADGAEVPAMVREHQPDVVLLDLKMEHVSGLD